MKMYGGKKSNTPKTGKAMSSKECQFPTNSKSNYAGNPATSGTKFTGHNPSKKK